MAEAWPNQLGGSAVYPAFAPPRGRRRWTDLPMPRTLAVWDGVDAESADQGERRRWALGHRTIPS